MALSFETHAAFFSTETEQPSAVDPQVFVEDAAAPEATGPQGIKHVAGVRPALIERDSKTSRLFNAAHKPLGFDLQSWLAASADASIVQTDGKVVFKASFKHLQPNASYSLFENHFDTRPISFTPLDGAGTGNNFTTGADGTAAVTVTLPAMPTHDNAVLLVYHSDGKAHGTVRGQIGLNAHHQIIARPQ
ncbi:hypothetical protein [Rhodopseudomonas sp. B29]|uniref:hypothetical protein n=1 Tax=Rhodopseudomonas sp. B29 TaxID=95607 RepID=UPI00034622F3|nr:hypothetical protein [Rhodopseudomonas sp. B29]